MNNKITNIVIAGLGGQGVLTCANIIAYAAFLNGYDVKESEVHGMSQRGGSVSSDIRFGEKVYSPMISSFEADFLLLLSDSEEERSLHYLNKERGKILKASAIDSSKLTLPATLNTVLLGQFSKETEIKDDFWLKAIERYVPQRALQENFNAFNLGKTL